MALATIATPTQPVPVSQGRLYRVLCKQPGGYVESITLMAASHEDALVKARNRGHNAIAVRDL